MAKLSILAGATSVSLAVFVQDSSSTTGAGLTGLVYNSSGLTCYAVVPGSSAAAITLATLAAANSAWSSGGFKEIDATNMPGWYRFDVPNTNISTGRSVGIHFKGVTNMAPLPLEIELTGWNNQDGVRGGMTALPNAAAEAAGGLYTRGTGAGQITQATNGQIDVDAKKWNALTTVALPLVPTTAGRTLDVSAGGEAGLDWANVGSPTTAVDLSGTNIKTDQKVDLNTIKTQAVTCAGGVTVPAATLASTTNITAGTIATVSGNVNGSVGSVTGAVGSVTGAVGSVTAGVSVGVGGVAANSFAAGAIDAPAIAADAIGSSELAATAANEIRDAIFARAFGAAYGSFTFEQLIGLIASAVAAKLSGAATATVSIRNLADTLDVVVATVDASGNRTATTVTP